MPNPFLVDSEQRGEHTKASRENETEKKRRAETTEKKGLIFYGASVIERAVNRGAAARNEACYARRL